LRRDSLFAEIGGTIMAAWDVDLTTRVGARGAARTAASACFLYAGATAAGAVFRLFSGAMIQQAGSGPFGVNLLPFAVAMLAAVAGFRLQAGKGLFFGATLAVIIALELLALIASLSGLMVIALDLVVLIFLIQGLRGARALHAGKAFEDDDAEAFS
jgi:hypothetical protein